ncbi:MAG: hypothetical protein QOG87_2099 [Actinomycetota bacterium]|jgi:hypothetical protein
MANFKLDKAGLNRAVNEGMRKSIIPAVQEALDEVYASHGGRPLDEVKPALAERWATIGDDWQLPEPQLTAWAEEIANGTRVVARLKPLK